MRKHTLIILTACCTILATGCESKEDIQKAAEEARQAYKNDQRSVALDRLEGFRNRTQEELAAEKARLIERCKSQREIYQKWRPDVSANVWANCETTAYRDYGKK